jgi:DivIVA domain-containing protein
MAGVNIDRQAVERRDFPIARRGYDPAAVDAHLRAIANEIDQLERERADGRAESSLASTASSQVQSIIAAAEAAAADIERQAADAARQAREEADRDAADTREQAITQAREHIAAVARAASALLERVSVMDSEVAALVESLRAGASGLAEDLAAVETNMGELYDATSGRSRPTSGADGVAVASPTGRRAPLPPVPSPSGPARAVASPPVASPAVEAPAVEAPAVASPAVASAAAPRTATDAPGVESGDLDGARLIALNMALNGESRADADRYLAENFELIDRGKLIDEVYAAIEG